MNDSPVFLNHVCARVDDPPRCDAVEEWRLQTRRRHAP
jgi:hypothetical protein